MSIQPYNITLGEESPTFQYTPLRDGPLTMGWNSSYSQTSVWWQNEGSMGVGTAFRRTELNNAGFSLDFEGKYAVSSASCYVSLWIQGIALYLCLTANNQAGYIVTVDGNAVTKTASSSDSACSSFPGAEILAVADGLDYGKHTATLNATLTGTGQSLDFYGGVVTLSAGPAGTNVSGPVWVDDRSTRWVYEPWPWVQGSATGEYNNTHSYACNYFSGITATITFTGSSIVQLIGSPSSNSYSYTVELDNVASFYNASNFWWADNQTLFFAGGLDPTQTHTLSLVDFDANLPHGPPGVNTSGLYCINLDAVAFVQVAMPGSSNTSGTTAASGAGASQTSGSDTNGNTSAGGGSLSGGAIAGIVIGVVAVLALAAVIFFLLRRLRRRAHIQETGGHAVFSQSFRGMTPHPPEPTPFISPIQPTSAFTSTAPVSTPGAATASSVHRDGKGTRSNTGFSGVRPTQGPTSEGGTTSSTNDPNMAHEILQNAPTVDLVTILNQRLRREQADNVEEPPQYD